MLQESNIVELKKELNDKLEKEIVAFMNNQQDGVLYYGRNIFEISEHYIRAIFTFNSDIIANGDNSGDIKTVQILSR